MTSREQRMTARKKLDTGFEVGMISIRVEDVYPSKDDEKMLRNLKGMNSSRL